MSVDREEVRRIAALAKLRLDDDEADRLTEEMNRILEHAQTLRGLPAGESAEGARPDEADPGPGGSAATASGVAGFGDSDHDRDVQPDPLRRAPRDFAPAMQEGFFTVPPPPGVTADDGEADG